MLAKTFKQGVHPPGKKRLSNNRAIERVALPPQVIIPLSQHAGAPCRALVGKKDIVEEGQLIGEQTSFIGAPIHSSVSGKVVAVEPHPHPALGQALAIKIDVENESPRKWEQNSIVLEELSPDEIRSIVKKAGIVGMGGAGFPTAVKITPPSGKPIDTVILNGCECEPYLTADHRIMMERGEDCLFGLKAIMRATSAAKGIIGIEINKKNAIRHLKQLCRGERAIQVVPVKTKYPQGGEKMLIKALLKREVPSGGLPLDVGVIVSNTSTSVAIAEAIKRDKPLIERVLTVTGPGVEKPANYLVPIGTPIEYLLNLSSVAEDATAIILGGPMMGIAQHSLQVPVIKGTSGILVLTGRIAAEQAEQPCVRCARCVDRCPVGLLPTTLAKLIKANAWDQLAEYHIMDCIECGCCTYVCPSKIPIVQLVKWGKNELRKRKK